MALNIQKMITDRLVRWNSQADFKYEQKEFYWFLVEELECDRISDVEFWPRIRDIILDTSWH